MVFQGRIGCQVGLLRELVPKASIIGLLINPNYQGSEPEAVAVQTTATYWTNASRTAR